jgi:ribosomal protein L31E
MKPAEIVRLQKIEHLQANERHSEAYDEVRKWLNEQPERKKVIVDAEIAEIQTKIAVHQTQIDTHMNHINELKATMEA